MWGSSGLEYKNSIFLKTIFQHLSSFLNPVHSILEYKQSWTVVLHVYQYHSRDQQNWGLGGMRRQVSFHVPHFAQHMNLAMYAYTQSCLLLWHLGQILDWSGICRIFCYPSYPLRKNKNSFGIFLFKYLLRNKTNTILG